MLFYDTDMLSLKHRLKKRSDFDALFKKGRVVSETAISLRYSKTSPGMPGRAAFVVSAKTEKSAVRRNRAKRQARAILRSIIPHLQGYDLAFFMRRAFLEMNATDKRRCIERLLKRARL